MRNLARYTFVAVTLLTTSLWHRPTLGDGLVEGTAGEDQLHDAIDALIHSHAAKDSPLLQLPVDEVILALINTLQGNEAFAGTSPDARRRAYSALTRRYARSESGASADTMMQAYSQILAGLLEPDVRIRKICIKAIAAASREHHVEAAAAVASALRKVRGESNEIVGAEDKAYAAQIPGRAVSTLGSFGQASRPYLADIEEVFRDVRADDSSRWDAVKAMIRIVGIEEALDHFNELDPTGVKVLLWTLAYQGGKTKGTYNTNPLHRKRIRELIVSATRSQDVEVRTAALEALIPAFGLEVVIIRSPEDYQWNPSFIGTIEYMAANDPDSVLQQRAAGALQQFDLDRAVKKILRKREEAAEQGQDTPTTPGG